MRVLRRFFSSHLARASSYWNLLRNRRLENAINDVVKQSLSEIQEKECRKHSTDFLKIDQGKLQKIRQLG